MFYNELGFPPYEGLPGFANATTVDGFVEPEPGITPPGLETRYVNGGRFFYGGASGVPLGAIDCIRDDAQHRIYLGIVTRLNLSFNFNDFVMIVLRPGGPTASATDDLRIHIKPVESPSTSGSPGADGASPRTVMPPEPGDSTPTAAMPSVPDVRGNRAPFETTIWERSGMPDPVWTPRMAPNGFAVKVRSTNTGTARCWSVELELPTDGGAGTWVPLQSPFGLYIDVGRPFLMGGNGYIDQTPWPYDPLHASANVVVDPMSPDPHHPYASILLANWDLPAATMVSGATVSGIGSGLLVTDQASNPAKGVKFQGQESGIGVLRGGVITTDLDTTVNQVPPNTLVARLLNTAAADAVGVQAEFHVADFGCMGPYPYGATWEKVSAVPNPAPSAGQTITGPPSGAQDITLDWTISQADHDKLRNWNHTCMWVRLDSIAGPGTAVNFVESSVRRNVLYIGMSDQEVSATVDGPSYGSSLTGDGKHDMILNVVSIPIPRRKVDKRRDDQDPVEQYYAETFGPLLAGRVDETPGSKETVGWVSVVNAYQVTDKVLTIDGRPHKVIVAGGSYGFVAEHVLEPGETAESVDLTHTLHGGDLHHHGGGVYQLSLGEGEQVKISNRLKTVRPGAEPNGKGCLGFLVPFLDWIKKLFS